MIIQYSTGTTHTKVVFGEDGKATVVGVVNTDNELHFVPLLKKNNPIGAVDQPLAVLDQNPENTITFVFRTKESVDVLMGCLQKLKNSFVEDRFFNAGRPCDTLYIQSGL